MAKSLEERAAIMASNVLGLQAQGVSMIRLKNGLVAVLRDHADLVDTFAPVYRATRAEAFTALLTDIVRNYVPKVGTGKPGRPRKAPAVPSDALPVPRRPHVPPVQPVKPPSPSLLRLVARIRELFSYDEFTGELLHLSDRYRKHVGEPAGSAHKHGTSKAVMVNGNLYSVSHVCWLHHYGTDPGGTVRRIRGTTTHAIANLYVVGKSR